MLFDMTRQTNFVMIAASGFFCFTIITAFICILITSPSDRAAYHYKQAQFLENSYDSLLRSDYAKLDLLRLSESELLNSLYLNPYDASVWMDLADVAQRSHKSTLASHALRFSHQFSGDRVINHKAPEMTVASNEVTYSYE